jgi:large subunit ribosomal protein L4
MAVVEVKNLRGEVVGEVALSDEVFGRPLNEALIYDAVRWFTAKQRAGTASTKTRGEVSGAGKKLWRQKGTGRARIGSLRSPVWRHGGTTQGPRPRDYGYEMPKKMRRGALASAISERLREGNLLVIDQFALENHKTKELAKILATMGLDGKKALIVDSLENQNLALASRNLPKVKHTNGPGVNIYDTLYYETLVFSQEAIKELEGILSNEARKA